MSKKLAIAMFGQKRLSREGGVEIVVKELCTRMAQNGCDVTCYNRAGHHVSGAEYDDAGKTEYEGIRQKSVPTIERRGLAAVSSSAFAALYSAFGKYDVVHIHAEGPAFFAWLPKMFGKRVVVTVHGIDWQREKWQSGLVYGDNVFEKDGIRRDRTGDGEKTRCLCGKRGIFNRDGPAMGPQIIRQLERRASRRSASFFHALASPGRPRNGGGASGAYQPAEGRKALIQGHFRAQEGPLGPSRKSQQQTKRTGFAALEDSIADEAPEGKRAKRANRALNRAGINSRGQKQGFGGVDRRRGGVTSCYSRRYDDGGDRAITGGKCGKAILHFPHSRVEL